MSLAAYRRHVDPHKRGRRTPSCLRNESRSPPASCGRKCRRNSPTCKLVNYELMKLLVIVLKQMKGCSRPRHPSISAAPRAGRVRKHFRIFEPPPSFPSQNHASASGVGKLSRFRSKDLSGLRSKALWKIARFLNSVVIACWNLFLFGRLWRYCSFSLAERWRAVVGFCSFIACSWTAQFGPMPVPRVASIRLGQSMWTKSRRPGV